MAQIVVGLYPSTVEGESVMRDLQNAGFSRSDISLIQRDREHKRDRDEEIRDIVDHLTSRGASHEDAEIYAEGIVRGSILVTVKAQDKDADKAADIMARHKASDIHRQAEEWRAGGWIPKYGREAAGRARTEMPGAEMPKTEAGRMEAGMRAPGVEGEERHIPVVEEQLRVGKREVSRPGIRVFRHVTERPVEEKVRLTEEEVRVQRRPLDRPLSPAEREAAFREETIEVSERREEPVISKEAHVVEDVVIGKETRQHEEIIHETIKRSDVEVQRMAAGATRPFGEFDEDFRRDFQTRFGSRGGSYETYEPAYRFGTNYSTNERYTDWNTLEPVARREWESQGGRSRWDEIKDAIRFGWERARRRSK